MKQHIVKRPTNNRCDTIGRFTVTSHAESRGRLRRLVGRREKLAAIYLVFTVYSSANKQFWCCRGVY